jgi:VCBS repeat-containing protein
MPRIIMNGTTFSDRLSAARLATGDFARSFLGDGNDVFEGSDGGDELFGEAGNDSLFGGLGRDSLVGGTGNDTLDGGDGNDTLDGGEDHDSLSGGAGRDVLHGGSGNNTISGGDGDDTITAGDGNDMILGDAGNDSIVAGAGNNFIYGGLGRDTITAGDGGDMIWGDAGNDSISAGGGNNWVYGGDGNDTISAGAGGDMLYGDAGDDVILDLGGNNFAYGGSGRDQITMGDGNDVVFGDAGDDVIHLGGGLNFGYGGEGHDALTGGAGVDILSGDDGADTLAGGAGMDQVFGGAGDDLILQGLGDGAPGQDMLRGGAGTDTLRLLFTRAEWFDAANQVELARLVAANDAPAARAGGVVMSVPFGFNFAEIETLSVSVDGVILTAADDPVTARADSFTVQEGAAVSGSVVANDTVPDLIASVVLEGAAPSPGSFSLSNAGLLSFDTGTSFEHLAAGQVAVLRFQYRVTDADGDFGIAQVKLRVIGQNDAATITGTSTGAVVEDGTPLPQRATGTLTVTDVDTGEARFATPSSLAGTYGGFSFNANSGVWRYTLDNASAQVQALNDGEQVTDTLTVTSFDGTASRAITVTITGRNDAASISGTSTGSVAEDGTLTTSGQLIVSDVDAGQAVFATPGSLAGIYGSFTFNAATGEWGYTLDNGRAEVDSLRQGQSVQDTLFVTSLDGTASRAITVQIAGSNDAPRMLRDIVINANTVLEGAASGTSTHVIMQANDPDGDALTYSFKVGGVVSQVDETGRFAINATTGAITVQDGGSLNFEAASSQVLTVFARDAWGAETSTDVTIRILDRDETPASAAILTFDDVPGGALADGAEQPLTDYAGFTFSQAGIYNPDGSLGYATSSGTTLAFFAEARGSDVPGYPGVAGSPLVIERADGTDFDFYSADFSSAFASSLPVTVRAYDDGALVGEVTIQVPNGAAQNFDFGGQYPGQRFTSVDRLEFSASDYFGLDDFAYGNVTAIIGGTATGSVAEDGTLTASGQLSITDPDPGQAGFATPGSLVGTYGSFTFNAATGEWGYTLNNSAANVQALNAGQTVQDVLTVTSLDGTASRAITVNVAGANDAASISGTSTGSVAEDGTLAAAGQLIVSDVDAGQAGFAVPLSLDGTYGSFTFNATTGEWGYTLNNSAANVQALNAGQTVQDVLTVTSLDGTASQAITVNIGGASDATRVVADFEGLPLNEFSFGIVPNGYQGFDWNNAHYVNGDVIIPGSGYDFGQIGMRVAYTAFASPVTITRSSDFDFESAVFTAAWENQTMIVEAWDDGNLVGSQSIAITTTSQTLVSLDDSLFDSVDQVVIRSPIFSHIVMDNLEFWV